MSLIESIYIVPSSDKSPLNDTKYNTLLSREKK